MILRLGTRGSRLALVQCEAVAAALRDRGVRTETLVIKTSGDRLAQPTNVVSPGAPALALQAANNLNKILIDDANNAQNVDPIIFGRGGMPLSQVEKILTDGSGQQWDPAIIRAYFASRDDIRRIWETSEEPRSPVPG